QLSSVDQTLHVLLKLRCTQARLSRNKFDASHADSIDDGCPLFQCIRKWVDGHDLLTSLGSGNHNFRVSIDGNETSDSINRRSVGACLKLGGVLVESDLPGYFPCAILTSIGDADRFNTLVFHHRFREVDAGVPVIKSNHCE